MLMPGQASRVEAHLLGWAERWREAAESMRRWIEFVARQFQGYGLPTKQVTINGLSDLSSYLLHARDFAAAHDAAEAGMQLEDNSSVLARKRAHALVFLERLQDAEQWYQKSFEWADRDDAIGPERLLLEDLALLEQSGLTHPAFARIREMAANRAAAGSPDRR
jgi:hypothetical protein